MNEGKRVAESRTRTTVPPSWSTPMNAGYPRSRTASCTEALTAAIWVLELMFSATGTTPPRCSGQDHPRRRPGTPVAGHHDLAGELGQRQPTHERPGVPDLGAGRTPGRRLRRPLDLDHRTRPFPGRHGGSGGGRRHHRGAQEQHHDGGHRGGAHTRNSRNRRDSRVAEPPTSAGLTRPVAGVG